MSEPPVSPVCEAVLPELNGYVDGELHPMECRAVESHLEGCAGCRAEVALLRLVARSLRLAPQPEPSEAMRQRLLARVAAELPLRRIELCCTERHGGQVVSRREVVWSREPEARSRLEPLSAAPRVAFIQQHRQERAGHSSCYQVIESYCSLAD